MRMIFFLLLSSQTLAGTDFHQFKQQQQSSDIILFDSLDRPIQSTRNDFAKRKFPWLSLDDISPYFLEKVIESEDQNFYHHSGIDFLAIIASLKDYFLTERLRGASTITMQLSSLIHQHPARKSIFTKIEQIVTAWKLEKRWNKSQILEAYLNLLPLRGETIGLSAFAQTYLEKKPRDLNHEESLLVITHIPRPNLSKTHWQQAACSKAKQWDISCQQAKQLISSLSSHPTSVENPLAPHFLQRLNPKNHIYSYLKKDLQSLIIKESKEHLLKNKDEQLTDISTIVIENKTGHVLAYTGTDQEFSQFPYVDGVTAYRQVGSTLKPFIYALALENEVLTPTSLIEDDKLIIGRQGMSYGPQNFDSQYHGNVTVRDALGSSLNIPAVKTLDLISSESLLNTLKQMEMERIQAPSYYGPSLALGSIEIRLDRLTNAYRMLANAGIYSPLVFHRHEAPKEEVRILSAATAFLIASILSDNNARGITFGLNSLLRTPYWTAAKTGTSKDMRDNWCIGFSQHFTVGVWAGNFAGRPMRNVTGLTGACPLWRKVMDQLHSEQHSEPPDPPLGVVRQKIRLGTQDKWEYFKEGTEFENIVAHGGLQASRIIYPPDQAIFAYDPDIPKNNQKILFDITGKGELFVNQHKITSPQINIKPGHYHVQLKKPTGQLLHQINFSVR